MKAQSPIHWIPKDVLFSFLNDIPLGKLSVQIISYLYSNASTAVDGKRNFLEASPPNNVNFSGILICSIMLPVRFHGSSWHRADQPHSKYSNVGILEITHLWVLGQPGSCLHPGSSSIVSPLDSELF